LPDQVDPPARGVHLLAPELIGRAGGQAEAAVHAVADHLPQRARRVEQAGHRLIDRVRHQIPPAKRPGAILRPGSNRAFTARISGSDGTGPNRSTSPATAAGACCTTTLVLAGGHPAVLFG